VRGRDTHHQPAASPVRVGLGGRISAAHHVGWQRDFKAVITRDFWDKCQTDWFGPGCVIKIAIYHGKGAFFPDDILIQTDLGDSI
jgi:hypothetical protein